MEKEQIKQAILQQVSEEIDQWLGAEQEIKDSYEYEEKFMVVAQKVGRILLTHNMGAVPTNRNKKNFKPVLGRSR